MRDVLREVWTVDEERTLDFDEECNPNKVCRNMKGVTFEQMQEPGGDLRTAWREKLAREGKLAPPGGSIRDLVLGPDEADGTA